MNYERCVYDLTDARLMVARMVFDPFGVAVRTQSRSHRVCRTFFISTIDRNVRVV
jgi:hypothetical protein